MHGAIFRDDEKIGCTTFKTRARECTCHALHANGNATSLTIHHISDGRHEIAEESTITVGLRLFVAFFDSILILKYMYGALLARCTQEQSVARKLEGESRQNSLHGDSYKASQQEGQNADHSAFSRR